MEGLNPAKVCLADGDLEVDLVSAVDYVEPVVPALVPRPPTPIPSSEFSSMLPLPSNGFSAFSGKWRSLNGKDSDGV